MSLSKKKTPHWVAKKKRKGTPQHLASALTVSNMLLLGFIQAKKQKGALPPTTSYLQW